VAEKILEDPVIRNVLFAPGGIVEKVYPLLGNEAVIGLDMNSEGAGNLEAQAAITENTLYMAGPFSLIQGGIGISGRLPVYINGEYWGIVSLTLDFPEVLDNSTINSVEGQGFACEIWRINPDDGKHQTILSTDTLIDREQEVYESEFELMKSKWYVSVMPIKPVGHYRNVLWCGILGALISLLAAIGVYYASRLRQMKAVQKEKQILELQKSLENERNTMMLTQISSHFFYHTLNSMQALIVMDHDAAYKMCGDFSRYLRYNVDSITAENGLGEFKYEMRAVKAYADINQAQLGDRLKMIYDYSEELDFTIPLLTIQPIVENAILHGIKQKVGGGTVSIKVREKEEHYEVEVKDDGVGFEVVKQRGYGATQNVKKRLAGFPGCSCETESAIDRGTRVVIKYPKNLKA